MLRLACLSVLYASYRNACVFWKNGLEYYSAAHEFHLAFAGGNREHVQNLVETILSG